MGRRRARAGPGRPGRPPPRPGHLAVPAEATIRRTLGRLHPDALAAAVGAWLADRDLGPGPAGAGRRRAVAIDGKTLRGAHRPTVTAARCTCWR
jgi:hypothetical protein